MQKTGFVKRFVIPVGIVLLTMVATRIIYHNSWRIGNDALQQVVAHVSAVTLFVSIGFGTLLIYPTAFFRGANLAERTVACLVTPVVWDVLEMIRVSEFFTFGEALYYGVNSVFLLSVLGAFGQMGLCEIICRWRLNKSAEQPVRVVTPVPVAAIVLGIAAFYVILLWGVGVHFFYIYMEGYKALFH